MKRTTRRTSTPVTWRFWLLILVAIVVLNAAGIYIVYRRPNAQAVLPSVPHYFATAGMAKPLPPTLEPTGFSNRDVIAAYQVAKEIPEVLSQQPCYCHCDRRGHRSLLDCFGGKHGSECDICVKEALFAMQEHRKGKAPEQIRTEIIRGDWKTIQFQD
jgi:hypothetical protein